MTDFIELSSTQNDLVKYAVKLQDSKFRKKEKMIFLDGEKTIEGLIKDNTEIEYLFVKKDNALYKNANSKKTVFVNSEILKKISSVKSPSPCAAIIKEPAINKDIFYKLKKLILLENIKDAGNLGTIIRSAAAFSMDGIILFSDCVDLYNTKVIRATAQNIFKLPIITTSDINFIKELKKTHKLISTVVDSDNDFLSYKFDENFILAFGSEASGLSEDIRKISDKELTLFMDNNIESLNLAVCASISFALLKLRK